MVELGLSSGHVNVKKHITEEHPNRSLLFKCDSSSGVLYFLILGQRDLASSQPYKSLEFSVKFEAA